MSESARGVGPSDSAGSADGAEGLEAQLEEIRADMARERRARHLAGADAPSAWRGWVLVGSGVVGALIALVAGITAKTVTGGIAALAILGLTCIVVGGAAIVKARGERRRWPTGQRRGRRCL
jgi:hypothetical protein